MNPRQLASFGFLIGATVASVAFAETNAPASPKTDYVLALRFGKEHAVSQEARQELYSKAIELLESSNFNSNGRGDRVSQIQERYRQTVSRRYLLVTLKEPQKVTSVGGELLVKEIVIGLNRPESTAVAGGVNYTEYASSLFTIDESGRVVEHGKYDGLLCIELMKMVKRVADGA